MFDKTILNSQAILVIGSNLEFEENLRKNINKENKDEKFFNLVTFGIAESHEVIRLASSLDKETCFFIKTSSITNEAQNALLKLTEEPSRLFQLIIVVPTDQSILDTFKSRFRVVFSGLDKKIDFDTKKFISADLVERLKMLSSYIEHPDDESDVKEKKEFFLVFLTDLHKEFVKHNEKQGLKVLGEVDLYGGLTAPSYRMFFEYLAINLPTFKK